MAGRCGWIRARRSRPPTVQARGGLGRRIGRDQPAAHIGQHGLDPAGVLRPDAQHHLLATGQRLQVRIGELVAHPGPGGWHFALHAGELQAQGAARLGRFLQMAQYGHQPVVEVALGIAQVHIGLLEQRVELPVEGDRAVARYRFHQGNQRLVARGIGRSDGGVQRCAVLVHRAAGLRLHRQVLRRGLHGPQARRRLRPGQVVHGDHDAPHDVVEVQQCGDAIAPQPLTQRLRDEGVGVLHRGGGGACAESTGCCGPEATGSGTDAGASATGGSGAWAAGVSAVRADGGIHPNHQAAPASAAAPATPASTQPTGDARRGKEDGGRKSWGSESGMRKSFANGNAARAAVERRACEKPPRHGPLWSRTAPGAVSACDRMRRQPPPWRRQRQRASASAAPRAASQSIASRRLAGADLVHAGVLPVGQGQRQATRVVAKGTGVRQWNHVVLLAMAHPQRTAPQRGRFDRMGQYLGQQPAVPDHGGLQQVGPGEQQGQRHDAALAEAAYHHALRRYAEPALRRFPRCAPAGCDWRSPGPHGWCGCHRAPPRTRTRCSPPGPWRRARAGSARGNARARRARARKGLFHGCPRHA